MERLQNTSSLVLLLFLLNVMLCKSLGSGFPAFVFPPDFAATPGEMRQVYQAFEDAIEMARLVAVTFDKCTAGGDPAFQRYFRPTDGLFVQDIFRSIANIDLNIKLAEDNVLQFLFADLNPKYSEKLSVSLGNHPSLPPLPPGVPSCSPRRDPPIFAFLIQLIDGTAALSFCDVPLFYPSLKDIFEQPEWAQGLEGYTCDGLGDHDSDWMSSAGATILHELIHWAYLFHDVPQFFNIQKPDPVFGGALIPDFAGPDPPNGYGCYHAKMIRDQLGGGFSALRNVDNYVCFAMSKYWSWKCQKPFGPARDEMDTRRRYDQLFPQAKSDGPAPDYPPPSP